jgi:hypothetical protein
LRWLFTHLTVKDKNKDFGNFCLKLAGIKPEPVYIPYSVFRATSPLASPVTAGFCVWLFHYAYFEIVPTHHTHRMRQSISSYPGNMSKLF